MVMLDQLLVAGLLEDITIKEEDDKDGVAVRQPCGKSVAIKVTVGSSEMRTDESKFVIGSVSVENPRGKTSNEISSLKQWTGSRELGNALFHCYFCEYSCRNKRGLSRHLYGHLPSYICKMCDAKFRSERTLLAHKKGEHSVSKRRNAEPHLKSDDFVDDSHSSDSEFSKELLHCYFCDYSTWTKVGLSKHVQGHLPPHICLLCEAIFRSERKLLAHEKHEHPESKKLQKQGNKFEDDLYLSESKFSGAEQNILAHKKRGHSVSKRRNAEPRLESDDFVDDSHSSDSEFSKELLHCYFCEYSTWTKVGLSKHVQGHLPPHICSMCDAIFRSERKLMAHEKHEHPESKKLQKQGNKFEDDSHLSESKFSGAEQNLLAHKKRRHSEREKQNAKSDEFTEDMQSSESGLSSELLHCYYCEYSFWTKQGLSRHLRSHLPSYICTMCDAKFRTERTLLLHQKSAHSGSENLRAESHTTGDAFMKDRSSNDSEFSKELLHCYLCEYSSRNKAGLSKHVRGHLPPHFCSMCDKKFRLEWKLLAHEKREHPDSKKCRKLKAKPHQFIKDARLSERFRCHLCEHISNSRQRLAIHVAQHKETKPTKFSCYHCEWSTTVWCDFVAHMKNIHLPSLSHNCTLCSFEAKTKTMLIRHLMETHKLEKPYLCDMCDYSCKFVTSLKTHKAKHTGEKPYGCDMCDYRTHVRKCLKTHMARHTGVKPYACDICDFRTPYAHGLVKHRRTHERRAVEKQKTLYICDTCAYQAPTNYYLRQHKRIHTGEKPYACDMCDYCSARPGDLLNHRRTHLGEKPYACDICDYRSIQSDQLNRHRRRHFGQKQYACDLCDYRSIRKSQLHRHALTHTDQLLPRTHKGEEPYACDWCDFRTTSAALLSVHERQEHPENLYACSECSFEDVSRHKVEQHLTNCHPTRITSMKGTVTLLFNCPECSFNDRSTSLVEEHMSECHPDVSVAESKIWASSQWNSD